LFRYSSIKDYHNALQNGQTTCVEAVRCYLEAIRSKIHLNAFLEVYEKEALEHATALDLQRTQGAVFSPLHGVVVGLKDVISYKGHHLSAASKILENFTAVYNATAVDKLLAAGAIIIGRQNCDEFAMGSSNENSAYGAVKNSVDESRVPGGSSGGSAVSVQAGLCMVSLGSDTGGSVRQPADFCGVVGIKPTYGRISRYGLIAYASSFDQIGIFANNVDDAAIVLEVISGEDDFDSTVSQKPVPAFSNITTDPGKKYRLAYFKEALEHPGLDPEIRSQTVSFIKKLTEWGHRWKLLILSCLNMLFQHTMF
jgi:aspartyl-tRNA(Asn)/glutamyl-tRNA(Gln) amidotransferase subunit A